MLEEREQLMQRLYAADQEKRELTDNFAYVKDELDKWQMHQTYMQGAGAGGSSSSAASASVSATHATTPGGGSGPAGSASDVGGGAASAVGGATDAQLQ